MKKHNIQQIGNSIVYFNESYNVSLINNFIEVANIDARDKTVFLHGIDNNTKNELMLDLYNFFIKFNVIKKDEYYNNDSKKIKAVMSFVLQRGNNKYEYHEF